MLRKYFFDKTNSAFIQFFRYIFVGGAAFIVNLFALWFLTEITGFHYLISAAIGFVLGLITNYILSTAWVFSTHKIDSKTKEFGIFLIIGLIGLIINEILLWLFTDIAGIYYLISQIITAAIVLIWNFVARRKILFSR
jgi:putative flippase GtrA